MTIRPNADEAIIKRVEDDVRNELRRRLQQKGYGIFVSPHEIIGILAEEQHEFTEAVQSNKNYQIREELLDIAVGAIFGLVSMHYLDNTR